VSVAHTGYPAGFTVTEPLTAEDAENAEQIENGRLGALSVLGGERLLAAEIAHLIEIPISRAALFVPSLAVTRKR